MLLLSDFLGSDVRSSTGEIVGRLLDLTVRFGAPHPTVRRLVLGQRGPRAYVDWDAVTAFEQGEVQLSIAEVDVGGDAPPPGPGDDELLLAADVLDTQIVDVAGKRLTRVADVLLARSGSALQVAGVEVGASGVWRRLGWRRLAGRTPSEDVDWADLHLTSTRGHALQLARPDAAVHRLRGPELASVMAHLPAAQAAQILGVVTPTAAAGALRAAHPSVGARLLPVVPADTAAAVVGQMTTDDATAVLRRLDADSVEVVLGAVATDRAATLRRLLRHRAGTAGGLMNSEVHTAGEGESVEMIRARVAAGPPDLEGLTTVFVVDEAGRPVGRYEPNDLLAGRATPRPTPTLASTLPVERVIDLFALQDVLALPVVDDEGRLIGVVGIDDVLEELLVERLPGRRRYAGLWSRIPRRHRNRRAS